MHRYPFWRKIEQSIARHKRALCVDADSRFLGLFVCTFLGCLYVRHKLWAVVYPRFGSVGSRILTLQKVVWSLSFLIKIMFLFGDQKSTYWAHFPRWKDASIGLIVNYCLQTRDTVSELSKNCQVIWVLPALSASPHIQGQWKSSEVGPISQMINDIYSQDR